MKVSQPRRRDKLLEEAIGRDESAAEDSGRKVETRLERLAKMYAAGRAKQAEEGVEEDKKTKLAKMKRKTKEA